MVLPLLKSDSNLCTLALPNIGKGFMRAVRPGLELADQSGRETLIFDRGDISFPQLERLSGNTGLREYQSLGSLIRIKHPLIGFIEELSENLRRASNKALTAQSDRDTSATEKTRQRDSDSLLNQLEHSEKRLELISHSLPSLDDIQNLGRESAHKCAGLVRELRRDLIGNHDKSHSIASLLDEKYHQLFAEKLSFERAVVNVIKQRQNDSSS